MNAKMLIWINFNYKLHIHLAYFKSTDGCIYAIVSRYFYKFEVGIASFYLDR